MPELHNNPPPPPDAGVPGNGIPSKPFSPSSSSASVQRASLELPSEHATLQFDAMFVLPVKPEAASALRALLQSASQQNVAYMQNPQSKAAALLPFAELDTLHYARLIFLEDEHGQGPRLVLATDFDGPEGQDECTRAVALHAHLQQIAECRKLADGLDRLFQHCKGYRGAQDLTAFLTRHAVRSRTFYVGAPGRSVKQIRWELHLRKRIEALLAQPQATLLSAADLRESIRRALSCELGSLPKFPAQPDFSELLEKNKLRLFLIAGGVVAGTGVVALALGPVGIALAGAGVLGLGLSYVYFRKKEDSDPQYQITHDAQTLSELERASDEENHFLQNPLTHLVEIKPGLLRDALIRVVFAAVQYRAKYVYNKGKLGEIPSIHFARWAIIPPRHVLFLSNFDSSWQSYLGDFIDKASSGLTAVWSNTVGYPRTKNLLKAGSRDAARFLAWTRFNQRPTALWYCAYPGLSIVNINDNTAIRRGLAEPECMDAESWLYRLRAVDREAVDNQRSAAHALENALALDRVQGIIIRGYGHMPHARYVMLRVNDGAAARAWLGTLELTNAEDGSRAQAAPGPLLNIAFTSTGLSRLGVDQNVIESFAPAFVQGSHHPQRARINGDQPASWEWGNEAKRVDVLLLVYAKTADGATREVETQLSKAQASGLEHVVTLEGGELPGRKEHFGFRDGIGQPLIRGVAGSGLEDDAIPAGEFLLGHRDAYDNVSHAPTSPRGFSVGHDGSYLVFRQLEQKVAEFWKYCASQADKSAVRVASKLVGRWPSGASLVRHPDADPNEPRFEDENDFDYLENGEDNDRFGARCPFGSHIRRSNPRDWNSAPTREEATTVSNRHRIVRRGRPYGPPLAAEMSPDALLDAAQSGEDGAQRGLQFLCFNSNIDRQFEFIQQHWCNNPHFAGLDNSRDPLVGCAPAAGSGMNGFTPQNDVTVAAPASYSQLPSFVRVVGSSYFFMPSIAAVKLLAEGELAQQPCAAKEQIPADESLAIDRLLAAMRRKMLQEFPNGLMRRGTHAKMHGCVEARFRVAADAAQQLAAYLPPGAAANIGLFGTPREYKAWVRFSNQRPNEPDQQSDLRAVAIKLLDVPGVKLLDGEEKSTEHDFIMISLDAFLAKNAEEFAELVEILVDSKWRLLPFVLTHPRTFKQMVRVKQGRGTLLQRSYFSAVPYLLGEVAVKYSLRPARSVSASTSSTKAANYLRNDMQEKLERESFAFDFLVQVQRDPKSMPIEDATVVWDPEKAPFVKVGTLELLKQRFDTSERNTFGENLSFNPWRCLPAHRPLGGLNRARREIYRALARFRHERNGI